MERVNRGVPLTLLLLILSGQPSWGQSVEGKIDTLKPVAQSGRGTVLQDAQSDSAVRAGDILQTEESGSMSVNFLDKSVLHLLNAARVRLLEVEDRPEGFHTLHSLGGGVVHVYCKKGTDVQIQTPTATSKCGGTDFMVFYDPAAERTKVVGVNGTAIVTAVAKCAERTVQVPRQFMTTVAKGGCPTKPSLVDSETFAGYVQLGQFMGDGRAETIDILPELPLPPVGPTGDIPRKPPYRDSCVSPADCVKPPSVPLGNVQVQF